MMNFVIVQRKRKSADGKSVLGKLSDLSSRTDTPVKAAKAKEAER